MIINRTRGWGEVGIFRPKTSSKMFINNWVCISRCYWQWLNLSSIWRLKIWCIITNWYPNDCMWSLPTLLMCRGYHRWPLLRADLLIKTVPGRHTQKGWWSRHWSGWEGRCPISPKKIKLIIALSRTYHRPLKCFAIFPMTLSLINNGLKLA